MNKHLRASLEKIHNQFQVKEHIFRDQVTLTADKEDLIELSLCLRDRCSFAVLLDETAVDYWPGGEPRFHLVYNFYAPEFNARLRVRTPITEEDPVTRSLVPVYPAANWYEREIWDLFGIRFEGHPNLVRIMLPKDWEGHPLRKDIPVKVEENRFSFNYDDIDQGKIRMVKHSDSSPDEN
jgi:NADH-quinone oxidoreductase subunit C